MDKKRSRDESSEEAEADLDSPEVKKLKENLLNGLDDDELEFCAAGLELDSFMKSFEEEISPSPSAPAGAAVDVFTVDQASDFGDSRLDLGYLLEASDDELGIPPPPASSSSSDGVNDEITAKLGRIESELSDFGGEFWEVPPYDDPFGFGFGEADTYNCEYVALDGLFDRSDSGRSGEFTRQPETLPGH